MIKTVGIDNDIKITDQIRFILSTTNSTECLNGIQKAFTPYKVNQVTIYYIARDFTNTTVSEYNNQIYNKNLLLEYENQKNITCDEPNKSNLEKLNSIKLELEQSKKTSSFFFKEASPIKIFGGYKNESGELFPAWINPDLVPIEEVEKANKENMLQLLETGKFLLEWNPVGCREGDYFICWNWTPNLAGTSLSAHMHFTLLSDSKLNNSIPTHYTIKDKYETLLDRYLPDMFKNFISEGDLTPMIMQELNASVAKGFTFVEDMANQIIDLLDSNSTAEQLLPLLSNTFNLRLKSYDPILWRRQIKKAIPNFKKKGTLGGLKTALEDAGMKFLKLTKLWQVYPKYTYQEHFIINESLIFNLSKPIIEEDFFSAFYKIKNTENWIEINSSDIEVINEGTRYYIKYNGSVNLKSGDLFRILYTLKEIPNSSERDLEEYVLSLDLMDSRNESNQQYPPKNWNTRLIEDDDPLFDRLIPIRHPIQDPIIWGKIRTEFPYSENVYNMEEYNGSIRDSINPCDIGKEFIDPCSYCQSSKITLDVEIENFSNDRILECAKLVEEYVPFHSLLHNINFLGGVNEFVKSPLEEITSLVSFYNEDTLISGNAQFIFNRSISRNLKISVDGTTEYEGFQNIKRNLLSQMEEVSSGSGVGYNQYIALFCPSISTKLNLENSLFANKTNKIEKLNIDQTNINGNPLENSNLLEIIGSPNAGNYTVQKVSNKLFKITSGSVPESSESPIDKSQFEFRISNKIYSQSGVSIEKDNEYIFTCNFNFSEITIKSKEEFENCYKIKINETGYNEFNIIKILPNNQLILEGPMPDFNISNLSWELLNENDSVLASGFDGVVRVNFRALVDLDHIGSPINNIRDYAKIGDYVYYDGNQYKIKSFIKNENHKFYIENFQGSIGSSEEIIIYRRIIENSVGQLDYIGLVLETSINYETSLPIQNETQLNQAKENYLILIDSEYYSILDIDGNNIYLNSPKLTDWTTLGTDVEFTIYNFINQELTIEENVYPPMPGHTFDTVNRSDNEVITNNIQTRGSFMASRILNSDSSSIDQIFETSKQDEKINFTIEYDDGKREDKNI